MPTLCMIRSGAMISMGRWESPPQPWWEYVRLGLLAVTLTATQVRRDHGCVSRDHTSPAAPAGVIPVDLQHSWLANRQWSEAELRHGGQVLCGAAMDT